MAIHRRRFRPQLERLEFRSCPAVDVFLWGRSLIVRGDASDDLVTITDDGQGNVSATITNAGGSDSLAASNILSVVVYANDGNDVVNYNFGAALVQRRNIYLYLGNGNDQANLNVNAGLDAGGDLYAVISGWAGDDQLTADFGPLTRGRANLFEYLAAGDDHSTIRLNGLVDRSIVNAMVNGGYGNDQLDLAMGSTIDSSVGIVNWASVGDDVVNATIGGVLGASIGGLSSVSIATWDGYGNDRTTYDATGVNINSAAALSLSSNSYQGNDTVNVAWTGELDGRLGVLVTGGMLSDNFTVNLTVNPGSTGALLATMIGWWAPDTLTLNVFDNSGGAGPSTLRVLRAFLDGGAFGANNCTHTSNVFVVNC